ncbi:MAG: hypothetical protein PHT31_03450 [Candidatus Omnitrophica bacterium]|nr:hypothetical protein [Candidatus Omnitrophota bacterium]MDD5653200.1 hypothetical protein [Candidatus Omnitrophota bacterium]
MLKQRKKHWSKPKLTILSREFLSDTGNNVLASCKYGSGAGWTGITADYGSCVYPYGQLCATCDKIGSS